MQDDELVLEIYGDTHMEEERRGRQNVRVSTWVDWTPLRERQDRELCRILRGLHVRLQRAKTWNQARTAIEWALNENKSKESGVYYSQDEDGKRSYFLTNNTGKLIPLFVTHSSAAGYKHNLTIRAFVYGMHIADYGYELAWRTAWMFRKRNGDVAMDWGKKGYPMVNKFAKDMEETNERYEEYEDLFLSIMNAE
jgi:hypothetical protein